MLHTLAAITFASGLDSMGSIFLFFVFLHLSDVVSGFLIGYDRINPV